MPFKFDKINLYAFFSDFIDELSFECEKDQSVSLFANEKESFIVKADLEHLKRVVINIIQNSLKYMDKEKKQIKVYLKSEPDQIVVKIEDNGSGISKEYLPYIFESFYRTDSSRNSQTGGSGLGLSIVKKIINEHGGKTWAESEVGEGTSIYFTLKKVI